MTWMILEYAILGNLQLAFWIGKMTIQPMDLGFFPLNFSDKAQLELDGMVKWVCLREVPNSNG